jgi:hypothetical protein
MLGSAIPSAHFPLVSFQPCTWEGQMISNTSSTCPISLPTRLPVSQHVNRDYPTRLVMRKTRKCALFIIKLLSKNNLSIFKARKFEEKYGHLEVRTGQVALSRQHEIDQRGAMYGGLDKRVNSVPYFAVALNRDRLRGLVVGWREAEAITPNPLFMIFAPNWNRWVRYDPSHRFLRNKSIARVT